MRVLVVFCVVAKDGVLWRICGWQLELGLLLQSHVGRGRVGAEAELDVLLVRLVDAGRHSLENRQNRIGDGKSRLLGWRKWSWECDLEELRGAASTSVA